MNQPSDFTDVPVPLHESATTNRDNMEFHSMTPFEMAQSDAYPSRDVIESVAGILLELALLR